MSKYIKLEDAIRIIQNEIDKVKIKNDFDATFRVGLRIAKNRLSDLPTIEISDGTLKVAKNFYAYTIADENAEMGMRTQIDAIIEISEDCISRADLIEKLKDHKAFIIQTWNNDFSIMADIDKSRVDELDNCISVVMNAPSVVPSREEPKRGKWIVYPLMDEGRVELECPRCGDTFIRAVDYKPHFCENCGARMESDKE